MSFADWWKKSSAQASADYEKLRFDAREINNLRGGIFDDAMRNKIRARLKFVGKIDNTVLLGCGIPAGCAGLLIFSTIGFFFLRALYRAINPVTIGFSLFFVLFTMLFVFLLIKGAGHLLKFKRDLKNDLKNSVVGVTRGRVNAIVKSSGDSFSIIYQIGETEFPIIRDVIGSEIHNHFWGGNNLTGKTSYQTSETYNFYHLPKSKLLLYFERA